MSWIVRFTRHTALTAILAQGALSSVSAQSTFDLVSQSDFECRRAEGPPPVPELHIRQLNPVLQGDLPNQKVELGPLEEVCVPVAKNFQIPSQPSLDFIRWTDMACYRAHAAPVDVEVDLSHLNPVLANLPGEHVRLKEIAQVCLPVSKNNALPESDNVRLFTRHFDQACYELEEPTSGADTFLWLSHLNPVIQALGHPPHMVHMERSRRLCVPIAKEQQPVPEQVLMHVRWADYLKYSIRPLAALPPIPLWLRHLNPLFADVVPFQTTLHGYNPQNPGPKPSLMVPVAKNGVLPPD